MYRVLIVTALTLAGCAASTQYFEPAERVQGQTLKGDKVAIYPMSVATGPFGEAKVWSSGAHEAEGGAGFVHIGLELHNTGSTPIELRSSDVTLDVLGSDGPVRGLRPLGNASRAVAPGAIDESTFEFGLPPGMKPGQVSALRFHWQVHVGDQIYSQRTPFIEEVDPVYYGYGVGYGYGYGCWPYGPYDCLYAYPYSYRYGVPVVPRYAPQSGTRTAVRPRR